MMAGADLAAPWSPRPTRGQIIASQSSVWLNARGHGRDCHGRHSLSVDLERHSSPASAVFFCPLSKPSTDNRHDDGPWRLRRHCQGPPAAARVALRAAAGMNSPAQRRVPQAVRLSSYAFSMNPGPGGG
jgi:hypothetical protein